MRLKIRGGLQDNNKPAFTLIELLVVIAIIGILATVSIISLSNARAKSRDAKRAGDMKQVQTALELFFNDNNRYPTATEWNTGQIYSISSAGTSTYLQVIPSAPTPNDGSCTTNQNLISYSPTPDGSSYSISLCLGNTTGTLTSGPKCLTPGGIIDRDCSCGDDIIDSRDSQSYPTVKIGGQCWLAKNLNYGTLVTTLNQTDDNTIEKYCYNNYEINPSPATVTCTNAQVCGGCDTNGGLYQWHEALQLPSSCTTAAPNCTTLPSDPCCNFATPRQGICPTGWHVPTDAEQNVLDQYLTGPGQTCDAGRSDYGCNPAGDKLKEVGTTHWAIAAGTNTSGFTALGSGFRFASGSFVNQGTSVGFWSSSVSGASAWRRNLTAAHSSVIRAAGARGYGFSVRCLRD